MEVVKKSKLKDLKEYIFLCGYGVSDGCSRRVFEGENLIGVINNGKFFFLYCILYYH